MASENSQHFVGRNRAPRVQIEYDVETNGAQVKTEIPFVMGVMSGLSGNPSVPNLPENPIKPKEPSSKEDRREYDEKRKQYDEIKTIRAAYQASTNDFQEVDVDNFDSSLKAMLPRVAFQVPNTLTEEGGNLSVELNFESMDDFSPAAIAEKVEPLKKLLDARTELKNLLSYMDGNTDAEELIPILISFHSNVAHFSA